jgi:DNA invertase Pin-like site-specific DNA recombinase
MRAIIYTRVSADQTGQGRSVASQEAECRAVCERNGWEVAEVLCDNDIGASRWSGKDRPEYKKLATILRQGDVLVTWEASRAQRDLDEYVELRKLCAERGVFWSYSGKLHDLTQGDGRFATGLDALLAEREAEMIRERVMRGKRAAAVAGRPATRPPWGYRRAINPVTGKTDGWVIDENDGPIVKDIIKRVLGGESLWAITTDLDATGIAPPQVQCNSVKTWRPQRLRLTISRPTYAGLRTHQGTVIGKGDWEALISVEEHEKLLAIFADPARRATTHRGSEPRRLLTGIATCGVCGAVMRWQNSKRKSPRYLCEGSCVGRRADMVDLLVTEAIIERLSRPDATALFAKASDKRVTEALDHMDTLRKRLDGFVEAAAAGKISPASLAGIEAKLLPQIEAAEKQARTAVTSPLVAAMAGPDARRQWARMTVKDRRTVVRALVEVVINPSTAGTRRFNPTDIEVIWKTHA